MVDERAVAITYTRIYSKSKNTRTIYRFRAEFQLAVIVVKRKIIRLLSSRDNMCSRFLQRYMREL